FLRMLLWKPWWRLSGEPGVRFLRDEDVPAFFLQGFRRAVGQHVLSRCPFATLMLRGRFAADGPLPIYLRRENFSTIRERLHKIQFVTGALRTYMGSIDRPMFDAFSLSDFGSHTPLEEYMETWTRLLRCARKGARVCERQFLVKRSPFAVDGQGRWLSRDT